MTLEIVKGTSQKPVASDELVKQFYKPSVLSGQLFIGYPIIGTTEGRYLVDALLVSEEKGVVIFDLIEGADASNYKSRQDDVANKIEARFKLHKELMKRRRLLIPIRTISFAPGINQFPEDLENDYPLVIQGQKLIEKIIGFKWDDSSNSVYRATLSVIESISAIRKTKPRNVQIPNSRGAKLENLEKSIATLDNMQSKAVIESIDGVQRIRGLAGSGKTIVLALKAAYFHAQKPEWRIAVTFNTRSLKGQFKRLIHNFSLENTNEEPNWENLRIVNAWGAPGSTDRDGIYYEFCRANGIQYLDFQSARVKYPNGNAFAGACQQALSQVRENREIYDAILVDEAQDFAPEFLQLCYKLLKSPKRLVYAYDELQNLSEESLPSPEDIFGETTDGDPIVKFDIDDQIDAQMQDIILERCYRNSRPVLVTAHALGFGIYRKSRSEQRLGLVQMFDHPNLWIESGYHIKEGDLKDGMEVRLGRNDNTSPKFLEEHSKIDDLVKFIPFNNETTQAEWVVNDIKNNLENEELRHDDIIVINTDPLTTRDKVGLIRSRLFEMGINSHIAGVDTSPDIFYRRDNRSITFTGIYRAKGNEAGMIYVINAQDCYYSSWNLATIRNRLFTAITRSKAWIRVTGIGENMELLREEYTKLREEDFTLKFRYPTNDERENLRIVHRDMTVNEVNRVQSRRKTFEELVADLRSGNIHIEDLDNDALSEFREFLRP